MTKGILPWFGVEAGRKSGGDDEFFGTREYKRGDPLKLIHWFSSARTQTLIVKEFQDRSFYRATILFNLSQEDNLGVGKESVSEYVIKIAASSAQYLIEHNISVEMIAHTEKLVHIPANKGAEHLEDILRFLAMARAESRVSLREVLEDYLPFIPNDSNIIVIMLDRDWEYLQGMQLLSKRSISVIPFILISASFLWTREQEMLKKDALMHFSGELHSQPFLFSCGENPEEVFLRY